MPGGFPEAFLLLIWYLRVTDFKSMYPKEDTIVLSQLGNGAMGGSSALHMPVSTERAGQAESPV